MNVKDVAEMVKKDVDLQINLDDLVHECFSKMASDVNNEGPEKQLEFLCQKYGMTVEQILKELEL